MKLQLITASLLALGSTAALAEAPAEGPWMMFVRAAHLDIDNGTDIATLEIENKTIPDISFRYSFTKNIAAELLLTVPQKHDVKLGGANVGSFKHLPPTLFAQYHFMPDSDFRPYVGAGINYTRISDVNLAGGLQLDDDSWGAAMQIGFDYKVGQNGYISVDLKKIYIDTDVKTSAGAKVGNIDVDPTVFAIGYGFRF